MAEQKAPSWAIVGGGMLGLTLAHRLSQRGQSVTVIEAASELGGLASPWELGDVQWDRFYHVTLLSDSYLLDLLEEIGLKDSMRWVETKTGFYSSGRLHSMSNSLEFLQFEPLTLIEKFRLGATIFYASKIRDWRPLEKVRVADWLQRISGKGVFEKIWLPLLKAKLGDAYKETSAAFIWAHISRMYKARRSGLKKEMFGYVPGGYATILKTLAAELASREVQFMSSTIVQNAASNADGGVDLKLLSRNSEGESNQSLAKFDRVVFTTPSPTIASITDGLNSHEQQRFSDIKYLGIVCASLLLKKPISPYYVTNITDTWVPLTAVIEMTTIVDPKDLNGRSLVYLPKYVLSDDPLFDVPDEELEERWLATLEKMYPDFSRDDVEAFRVSRAKHVMALPTLSYSEKLPPMATSVPGVYGVNSAHILKGNLNVNETIQIAEEAITGVLADAIVTPSSSKGSSTQITPHPPVETDAKADRELIARS